MADRDTDRLSETENWVQLNTFTRRTAIAGTAAAMGYALAAQPVAATTITTDTMGLDAGMVEFVTGDIKMKAYRAKPSGKKNPPVIFVIQEIFGVHEWIKDIVRRFALHLGLSHAACLTRSGRQIKFSAPDYPSVTHRQMTRRLTGQRVKTLSEYGDTRC